MTIPTECIVLRCDGYGGEGRIYSSRGAETCKDCAGTGKESVRVPVSACLWLRADWQFFNGFRCY